MTLDGLSQPDLVGVVRTLMGELTRLRAENEKLIGALTKLRVEHQAVKDEPRAVEEPAAAPAAEALGDGQGDGSAGV